MWWDVAIIIVLVLLPSLSGWQPGWATTFLVVVRTDDDRDEKITSTGMTNQMYNYLLYRPGLSLKVNWSSDHLVIIIFLLATRLLFVRKLLFGRPVTRSWSIVASSSSCWIAVQYCAGPFVLRSTVQYYMYWTFSWRKLTNSKSKLMLGLTVNTVLLLPADWFIVSQGLGITS